MDEELASIRRQAAAAQDWYSVAAALERLCNYIAKHRRIAELEEQMAELEDTKEINDQRKE